MKEIVKMFYKKAKEFLQKNWWDVRYLLLFAVAFLLFRFDKFIKWIIQDTGTVADWVSGLGTVGAFFAIFWQMDKQEKMERAFKVEQSRPRFIHMFRGVLPDNTNILLDDNNFFASLGEKGYDYLKLIVNHPSYFNLLTLDNISSNTIYTCEVILTDDFEKEYYWVQNGLQQNSIIAPVPVSLINRFKNICEKQIVPDETKEKNILLHAKEIEVRFTTSSNEIGFYKLCLNNNEEKYYFINESNNNEIQASKNGKILGKNNPKIEVLNSKFDAYKSKRMRSATIPYHMLKIKILGGE